MSGHSSIMQEYYSKTQSLYKEFQRCEEHFRETESKWKSSKLKKDLEIEEYLRKIEQREKETEESVRDIMNQIDNDRHANLFHLELNQLQNDQNSLSSHTYIAASSGLETNLLSYSTVENLIPKPTVPHSTLESLTKSSKCESTQTENAYCEKCNSLNSNTLKHFLPGNQISSEEQGERTVMGLSELHIDSESLFTGECLFSASKPLSNTNTTTDKVGVPNVMNSSTPQNDPDSSLTQDCAHFQPISSSKSVTLQENPEKYTENNSEKHFFPNNVSTNDNRYLNANKDTQNSLRDEAILNITADSNQENVSRVKNMRLKLQTPEDDSTETKLEDSEINVEAFTSKSDAESVNNEFDFLESDTKNAVSKKKTRKNSKKLISLSDKSNIKTDKCGELGLKHNRLGKPVVLSTETFEDDKSETSESVSGPQSPTISLASDSESNHGKGSPSTAYQKLLRTTVIPKNTKVNTMESDSEDEVEKALASTAQRTNLEPKIPVSAEKDEPVLQPESKPQTKESSILKMPQSKLSKNTRKVLGIDSSSGSEIELAVKPPNRNDDDDDEFDSFFN